MMQSKKLRNILIENTHQLPYENLLTLDLPDEIWVPFPVAPFDEFYVVSNKGRIKRLARIVHKLNSSYFLPERVVKQTVHYRYNKYTKQTYCFLTFVVVLNGKKKNYPTGRIIYSTFVKSFDLFDSNMMVRHKDGNGLNVNPDNLYLFERKKITKWIVDNNQRNRLVGVSDRKKWPTEEVKRWIDLQKKHVTQYDLNGTLVAVYSSRIEAAKATGVKATQITAVIKGKQQTAGKFLWIEGSNNPSHIEVPELKLLSNPIKCQKVAQYDLVGNLLHVFPTIKAAAESINISSSTLSNRIHKPTSPKSFIWKTVSDKQDPPLKIVVEPFVPIKNHQKNKPKIYNSFTYPYQNYSLEDMSGEFWKAIPETGNIYFASNFGRIKAVDHIIERNKAQLWQIGQIIRQHVKKNKKNYIQSLVVHFVIQKKTFSYQVPNLIYILFHGEIPHKQTIKYIDNNPLNCSADNLSLQPLSDKYKQYFEQGRLSSSRLYKPIAQFTLEGKLIQNYSCLKEASRQTGFRMSRISECANGKRQNFKGYIWKYQ